MDNSDFVHSFIHIEHFYSASSRKLLRSAPSHSTVKQSNSQKSEPKASLLTQKRENPSAYWVGVDTPKRHLPVRTGGALAESLRHEPMNKYM